MTVNSQNTRQFSIDKLVCRAIQMAALMPAGAAQSGPQWNALASQARDFLEMEVDYLQTEGVIARAVEFYDVQLTTGVASYDLPDDTLGVIDTGMYVPASGVGETPVKVVSRNEYSLLSDKTARARPVMVFPEMHAIIRLYL